MPLKKAAAYMRYSSDNQREESIDAQRRAITQWAVSGGYEIVAEYVDEAMTGTTDDRDAFLQMIKDAATSEWDAVAVHKFDRFSRYKYDSVIYKHKLRGYGVPVLSVLEHTDDSPESALMESLLEGMAEYFSRNLAREVKKGLRENALTGRSWGGFAPLGYALTKEGKFTIVDNEASAVRMVFDLYLQGYSYQQIADRLNALGLVSRAGKPFSRNSVHDMLRNEKYKGTLLYNRFVYDKQGRRRRPKPGEANANEIRVPNALPAIVDELTWEKVNQQMDLRAHAGKAHPQRSYLLSGILFCAECGSPMIGVRSRTTLSYRCAGKKAHLTNCTSSTVICASVDGLVIDTLKTQILNPDTINTLVPRLRKALAGRATTAANDVATLVAHLSDLDSAIGRIVDTVVTMGGSAALQAKLRALEAEKSLAVKALADLQDEMRTFTPTNELINEYLFRDISAINGNDPHSIQEVIHKYILKVDIKFDSDTQGKSKNSRNFQAKIKMLIPKNKNEHSDMAYMSSAGTPKGILTLDMYAMRW